MQTYYYQFIPIRTFRPNIIMPIAGSSASSEDFTPTFMDELGELLVHGITVMPGKPALLAAADAGLGIHAAAQALSLDFVPVARDATIWSSQTPIWKMKRSSFGSTSSALTNSRRRPCDGRLQDTQNGKRR